MSGPAHGNRNRSAHRAVVDLVQLALDARGISSTTKREPKTLSDSLGDDALDPDLALDGVDLKVTSRLTHRLSEDLESAQRTAVIRGTAMGALVQWRGDRPIDQAFVIVSLSDFATLAKAAAAP